MKKFLRLILILICPGFLCAGISFFAPPVSTSVTTTPAQIVAQDTLRSYLIIVNTGANPAIVKFGSAPASGTDGIPIPAGGNYEPLKAPSNAIYTRTASSTTTLVTMIGH